MSRTENLATFTAITDEAERLWRADYPGRNANTVTAARQIAGYFGQARRNLAARPVAVR